MSYDNQNSFERFIHRAEELGLTVRITQQGVKARIQTPGHNSVDDGLSITYNGTQTLVHCFNGDKDEVLKEFGFSYADLFDEKRSVRYEYPDARVVFRKIAHGKGFTQKGNTKGTALFGSDKLTSDGVVYVLEGEKDVLTVRRVWGANALSQAQGSAMPPERADWSSLSGRDVVIVADKDDDPTKPNYLAGLKRATKIATHLEAMSTPPKSIRLVEAKIGKDVSDHIAADLSADELVAIEPAISVGRTVTLVPASTVKTERLEWLVDSWLPKRSLTLLAGREGLGKSTIACGIAAQATRGELNSPPMNVAYLNTEDARSITVKPRLQAAGADLDRVFFIDVTGDTGNESSLSLPGDIHILERALARGKVGLVVLDAAKSAMSGKLDGHRDDDVREFLEPLAAMADRNDMVVLGLAHFGKRESNDTGKLLLGSIAWSQIARSVLSVAVDEEGTLVVTNTKCNLAPRTVSREATLQGVTIPTDDGKTTDVARVVWGEETNISAADLLVTERDRDDDLNELEAFLVSFFEQSAEAPRADVLKAAQKEKLGSESTIKRAFKKLGGVSERKGFPSTAMWSLPTSPSNCFSPITEASQVSQFTTVPNACESDPTDPTGDNQRKRNDPTVPVSQSGQHRESDPTDELTKEIQAMLLSALSDDYGLSESNVLTCVPTKTAPRDTVKAILDTLLATGMVTTDARGRYLKANQDAA